jgi:hypothetical protein
VSNVFPTAGVCRDAVFFIFNETLTPFETSLKNQLSASILQKGLPGQCCLPAAAAPGRFTVVCGVPRGPLDERI